MNHRLLALLLVLSLVLPFASVATHADGTPTTLVYVANQVNIDYFGGVAISTTVTVVNNGTSGTGPLSVNVTYGGVLTPYVTSLASDYNVTNMTGADTTSYMFNLASLGAGNYSQITLNLQLTGIVQETSPGVRTYNLTSFPFVDVTGGVLTNATASIGLPAGVDVTTDFTQYGFTQALAGTPSYTLVFTNNTVPQVSFVPVSYVQPDILFSVNNTVAIDGFGWVHTDTTVTVNNTGQAATGNLDANLTYFGLYVPYTWNQSSSSTLISTQETNDTTSYILSLPSIAAGGSAQLLLHLKTWGMINEFTAGTYTYNLTNFPIVDIPGGGLDNATSVISLPVGTTVSSALTQYGFVQQPPANPTYEQFFTDYTEPVPTVYLVNFTATSSDNFGLFQIDSVQRTVGMAGDGSVLVTEIVSITNFDTQDLSTFNLTLPISGQYSLKMGWVDGGYITLSDGLITLPVPISASSLQNLVIQYTLPSSAVKDNSGTITIDLGAGALNYTNLVQSYSVIFSFPSGTVAQASTPTSFVNQSVMPEVVLTAKVPLGWNLYLAAPAIVGLLIAAVFIFFLYRRANLEPFEEDGVSIIQAKAAVITSLLEQYRLRGEGFSSFDDYSAKRRSLEEEKTKVNARLQEYKVKGLKDKAQKSLYEKMAVEDARLEQLYREGKVSLEECLASRLSQKDFDAKIQKLELAAQPTDLFKKAEQKQAQAKPAKQ